MTKPYINVDGNNFGNIAGRDIVMQTVPSWIEKRKASKDVIHHFSIFFFLANDINDTKKRVMNPFKDCKDRMNREFILQSISVLDECHQKEIYKMRESLMKMLHSSECTFELQDEYLKKLTEISDYYSV